MFSDLQITLAMCLDFHFKTEADHRQTMATFRAFYRDASIARYNVNPWRNAGFFNIQKMYQVSMHQCPPWYGERLSFTHPQKCSAF